MHIDVAFGGLGLSTYVKLDVPTMPVDTADGYCPVLSEIVQFARDS